MTESRLVYVVDDDEGVRDSTHLLLLSHNITAMVFASPREFLASYDAARAACLVLDLHMPEMSGLEVLELMRANGLECPVIVLSGRRDPAHDRVLRRAGAMEILSKPPDHDEFLKLVRDAVTRN